MPSLDAIRTTGIYSLSDGNPFALIETEGGMANVQRITDRGPAQHGDSDIDLRLDPTNYPLGLMMRAGSDSELATNHGLALRIFRPSKNPIKLRWTLGNGNVRQIDVHVSGRLMLGSKDQRGFMQRFVVPLRAADPTYYDPTQQSSVFGVGGGGGAWAIPWAIPWSIGAATVDQTRAIVYPGTWRTSPIVLINGPINSAVVTNQTTGDKLDFTGYNIAGGDSLTIDCRDGVKTVVDASGTNRIDKLTDDSDLATFSLEADEEAPGGVNSIRVTGSAATSATEVYVQWFNRYVGLA